MFLMSDNPEVARGKMSLSMTMSFRLVARMCIEDESDGPRSTRKQFTSAGRSSHSSRASRTMNVRAKPPATAFSRELYSELGNIWFSS